MKTKMTIALIILALINIISSFFVINILPETIPTHFDANMVCDGVGSRWLLMATAAFPFLAVLVIPLTMKFSKNAEQNEKAISISGLILSLLFISVNWLFIFAAASGTQLDEKSRFNFMWILSIVITVFFMIIGNFMPTIKQNGMLGLRIPWTLKNEQCWKITHRFCGKVSVYGGIAVSAALLIMAFSGASEIVGLILMMAFIMGTMAASIAVSYRHRND